MVNLNKLVNLFRRGSPVRFTTLNINLLNDL